MITRLLVVDSLVDLLSVDARRVLKIFADYTRLNQDSKRFHIFLILKGAMHPLNRCWSLKAICDVQSTHVHPSRGATKPNWSSIFYAANNQISKKSSNLEDEFFFT